ncbi:MAG: hypothetical protein AB8G86_11505 [Saprospiraceae bacterium]
MKHNKLINLLRGLTSKEFNRLEAYAGSPFFINKRKDLPLLYKALKKFHPNFEAENLSKEALFKKVHPKEIYNDKKFRNLQADFVKIIENYLLFLENEENRFEKDKKLISIYEKRSIHETFIKSTNKLLKSLNNLPFRDAQFYYDKYLLGSKIYFHPKTKKDIKSTQLLKVSISDFEHYFLLERSKLGIDLKNRERFYPEKHDFEIDKFSHIDLSSNYLFQLYQLSIQLLVTPQKSIYLELSALYKSKIDAIRKEEQILFFIFLQNFIIQQDRANPIEYKLLLIKHFQFGLSKKVLFQHGKIQDTIFINLVSNGLVNGAFDWVKSIIKDYGKDIHEDIKGFTVILSNALIAFYEEDYETTIEIINTNNFTKSLHHFGFRTLIIRAAFIMISNHHSVTSFYYNIFSNHCSAFEKHIIRNHSKKTDKVELHLNFNKIIKRIGQLIFDKKWKGKQKQIMLDKLNAEKKMVYKQWLINILKDPQRQ